MGLTSWLLRHTPARPLVLTGPGGTGERVAAEQAIRSRGWRPAVSPAEANLLVVAGATAAFEPYVERVWHAMPAPKARVTGDLDAALARLRDTAEQRRRAVPTTALPDDVPMADRAPDRDGLRLDQLHVTLGPAVPLWPPGLIVHTRLQGDVVRDATVAVLDGDGTSYWPGRPVRRHLDSCARLLAVAGWADAALAAQRLRDTDDPPLERWVRRVRGSRTLRWLLRGVGHTDDGPLAGDALDRLYRRLDALTAAEPLPEAPQWTVDHLPGLLAGTELATARLIVASLDPDLDLLQGARHG